MEPEPASPMPEYVPGQTFFRALLEEGQPHGEPRQFRPIRAGAFLVSIQASARHASLPQADLPLEEYEGWEVAVFTDGGDGTEPRPVSPRSHPHLFRDQRWARLWMPALGVPTSGGLYWSGHRVPSRVVADLLDCLVDPEGYAALLARGVIGRSG